MVGFHSRAAIFGGPLKFMSSIMPTQKMLARKIQQLTTKNCWSIALDIQTPPEKVFGPQKTYLEHLLRRYDWMSRVGFFLTHLVFSITASRQWKLWRRWRWVKLPKARYCRCQLENRKQRKKRDGQQCPEKTTSNWLQRKNMRMNTANVLLSRRFVILGLMFQPSW